MTNSSAHFSYDIDGNQKPQRSALYADFTNAAEFGAPATSETKKSGKRSSQSGSKKRLSPLSIRPSDEAEREELLRRAGDLPFSAYAKSVLLDAPVHRASPSVSVDKTIVAELLAFLGSSRMAANLTLLADEARAGNLLMNELNSAMLEQACTDISEMRVLLMTSLGQRKNLKIEQ